MYAMYASDTFKILVYSALCFFRYMPAYLIIFSVNKDNQAYWDIVKAYSAPCVTLAYLQPCHILSRGIFRTGSLFKTLWNVDQGCLEPCHSALFSHIQGYSESCETLAYRMKKFWIFGTSFGHRSSVKKKSDQPRIRYFWHASLIKN